MATLYRRYWDFHTDVDFRVICLCVFSFIGILAVFTYMYVALCIVGSLLQRFYYSGEGTLMLGCVGSFIFPWFSGMGMSMSG